MKRKTMFDRVIDFMAFLAGAFLVAIVFIICADVAMRYFLNRPQVWTVEICEYLVFAIAFLGAPWLLKVGGHVNVDIVTERLPERVRDWLGVISTTIGAVVCGILTWHGLAAAIDCYRTGVVEVRTLDVPKYYFMLIIALGYLLISVEFCRQFRRYVAALRGDS